MAEDEAEKRRGRRLRNLLIAGAAAVVAIVIVAGGVVFMAQQNAETARLEAEAADRGAEATLLAFASRDLLQTGDVAGATAAAVDAVELLSTTETRSSLLQSVLALSPHLVRSAVADEMRPGLVAFVPDTSQVLVGGSNGRLHVWDPAAGGVARALRRDRATRERRAAAAGDPRSRHHAGRRGGSAPRRRPSHPPRCIRGVAGEVRVADDIGRAAAMAPGGERIVAASQTAREVNAYRLRKRRQRVREDGARRGFRPHGGAERRRQRSRRWRPRRPA